jgi:hypothetical protein
MTLARAWTRQLYGASGVALLAPVTMIAALAVLALGGGFGGLGALGQLVSGPAVPVSAGTVGAAVPGPHGAHRTAPAVLPVVPAAPVVTSAPTRVAAVSPAPTPAGSRGGGSPSRGGTVLRVAPGGHGVAPAPPRIISPPLPPPVTPTPSPPTAPLPALINQIVAVGVSVTSKLPAPVGAIGTGVLQSLGQTLSTLLTPPS